jgi:hypothetical protein
MFIKMQLNTCIRQYTPGYLALHYMYVGIRVLKVCRYRPRGLKGVESPRFHDNRHMKVLRFSALRTDRLYPQAESTPET